MSLAQLGVMSAPTPAAQEDHAAADDAEQALVARIASGDRRAFELLFNQYGERVFRYAYRLINNSTKAEEVTNDVMLEVWKNAAKFEGRSKVSTWLLGITRHLALNSVRRKQLDTVDVDNAPEIADSNHSEAEIDHDRGALKSALRGEIWAH